MNKEPRVNAVWIDTVNKTVVHYFKELHASKAHKFVGWLKNGELTILVGPGHLIEFHKDLVKLMREYGGRSEEHNVPTGSPIVVGNCERDMIVSWSSTGYDIQTPREFRHLISEELGLPDGDKP